MPWKMVVPVLERAKFITLVEEDDDSFVQLCRRFGISRKTGYKWLDRYEEEGLQGLQERPSLAGRNGNALSDEQVDAIVALRKEHPTWGPKKLRARLAHLGTCEPLPATSSFGAVLKRQGLVRPRRRRPWAPRELTGLTAGERPNDVWCVNFKGDLLMKNRSRCYPLTYNDVRPHEAIELKMPSSRYSVSRRTMPEQLMTPNYLSTMKTRRLTPRGFLHFLGAHTYVTGMLSNEVVGLEQVDEHKHELYYGPMHLGLVELVSGELVLDQGRRKRRVAITL